MSESNEVILQQTPANNAENQESGHAEVSREELQQRWDELQYVASLNPEVTESEEYKTLQSQIKADAEKFQKGAPVVKNKTAKAATKKEETEEQEEEEEESEEEDDDNKNPFITKQSKKDKVPEKIDDITGYMKKKYSIDEPSKFFESVDKWRKGAQEAPQLREELDGILNDLQNAPDPIKAALLAHSRGENWEDVLGSYTGRPDFNKDFKGNDVEHIVKYYQPDEYKSLQQKLNDGTYDEDQYEDAIKLLEGAAKRLFEKDKKEFETKRADLLANADKTEKALRASINSSVEQFDKEFPGFRQSDKQKVKQILATGNISSLFYEKNGTYRADAFKRLAFVLYGDSLYQAAIEKAERKGKSKANEEIVTRGNKEIQNSKSTQAATEQANADALRHLNFGEKKKDYM